MSAAVLLRHACRARALWGAPDYDMAGPFRGMCEACHVFTLPEALTAASVVSC